MQIAQARPKSSVSREPLEDTTGTRRIPFSDADSIYRIGGDEFCVIMEGPEDWAMECLRQLEINTSRWKGKFVDRISVSYGFASDKEFDDFDSMLKAADRRMYAFKSNYYKTSGKDRRHR